MHTLACRRRPGFAMPAPLASMTAFATRRGEAADGTGWSWDLRSVNGRGFEPRLRLPEGIDGIEAMMRAALSARIVRGSVTLTLRLAREAGAEPLRINPAGLAAALLALRAVADAAAAADVAVAPPTAAEVLAIRGVAEAGAAEADAEALRAALAADLDRLLDAFAAMRQAEGAALGALIAGHLDRIAAIAAEARAAAAARADRWRAVQAEALARLLSQTPADPGRLEQELALLASRADVTEELDRLEAHVAAARGLLAEGGPVGRRLDFLTQECLREANTLCSKAQAIDLSRLGLDLKAVIEQLREQVQNLE
jgi:uncharacterized protein (TIGR00255 family)